MEELISEEKLSEVLQVSRTTLWKLRKKGLPHIKAGKKVRYKLDEAIAWLHKPEEK